MSQILVLNGPNLNLLGKREPEYYGQTSLDQIQQQVVQLAKDKGHDLQFVQSNAEHELVDQVQQAMDSGVAFIIINPAAFTHTSVALRDALAASNIPFIEVHLSNIHAREEFRQHSYFSDLAVGVISGLGAQVYALAVRAACEQIK
ncbi:MAG: type II 3-dehydroquinate dehydratase [Gammaproteobacteria bacterium]|nr:MAG: type II 3-dehydroquinate dehydratase [Gammaproteobacteria bacterium]